MKSFIVALAMIVLVMTGSAFASAQNDKADKKGILVVSFGTSMPDAKKAIDNLFYSAKKAFPDTEVRLAYTSNIIRRKIMKEQNLNIPTPASALAQMNDEGFTHVYVMPMHIIPGEEFDDIRSLTEGFASVKGKYGFKELKLGSPYLSSIADCDIMADILVKRFAKNIADKGTTIVLMGHGTPEHIANAMYSQLQLSLDRKVPGRFIVGTVEGAPTIDDVIVRLKHDKGVKKIVLSPLMIVAGDHANNDLADKNDPESWYSILKAAGYRDIKTFLVGLGEDETMARIYTSKIKDMMK
ncbi:MAG: sirohydrochlorin cobaltochelatase [Synergistaceae bacterium]|nr:sirohydrochlorin cobaltochelatase [Synergistaceae bacterium]